MKAILTFTALILSLNLGAQVNFDKLKLLEASNEVSPLYKILDITDTNAIILDFGYFRIPKKQEGVHRKFLVFYGGGLVQHITHQVSVRNNNTAKVKLKKRYFDEIESAQLCAHLDSCILNGAFLLNKGRLNSITKELPEGKALTRVISHYGGPLNFKIVQGSRHTTYSPPSDLEDLILDHFMGYREKQIFLNMYQFLRNHI